MMGRRCYVLLRRRYDVPIRRLRDVPSRRRWVFHLRRTCDVAGTYRETSLRRHHDVSMPCGKVVRLNIIVACLYVLCFHLLLLLVLIIDNMSKFRGMV